MAGYKNGPGQETWRGTSLEQIYTYEYVYSNEDFGNSNRPSHVEHIYIFVNKAK